VNQLIEQHIYSNLLQIPLINQLLKESKLILERGQLANKNEGHTYTSLWMDMFIDKGSEIEKLLINTKIDVVSKQQTQSFAMNIFLNGTLKQLDRIFSVHD
jgi:hypothetical protein